jgi:archaellum component FlaG (FlaF/FlaG flagellin family)
MSRKATLAFLFVISILVLTSLACDLSGGEDVLGKDVIDQADDIAEAVEEAVDIAEDFVEEGGALTQGIDDLVKEAMDK